MLRIRRRLQRLFVASATLGNARVWLNCCEPVPHCRICAFVFWGLSHPSLASSTFPRFLSFDATGTFATLGGDNWIGSAGCHCNQYELSEDVVAVMRRHKFGFGASFSRGMGNSAQYRECRRTVEPQTLDAFFPGGIDAHLPCPISHP